MGKVLVIGGAGFIGSFVCREVLGQGKTPIAFDSLTQYLPTVGPDARRYRALSRRFEGISDQCQVVRGNAVNYRETRNVIEQHSPESVIFLGGIPLASLANSYTEEAVSGLGAVTSIVQAILDSKSKARFVYTSSSTVYGDFKYDPADEKHPCNPRGVYAGVKLAGEDLTKSLCAQFGISFSVVRPQGVYGPTDVNRRVVQAFIENAMDGKEIVVRDPTSAIDFTYVKDTAAGIMLAATHPSAVGETFNISAGAARTLGDLSEIVRTNFPEVNIKIEGADRDLPRRGSMDISKARSLIGYNPKYNLEDGVREYIEYYGERNDTR